MVADKSDEGSDNDGDSDDDDDEENVTKKPQTAGEQRASLLKLVGKNEAKIRDAPSTFEESSELYHMQTIAVKYISALIGYESVH